MKEAKTKAARTPRMRKVLFELPSKRKAISEVIDAICAFEGRKLCEGTLVSHSQPVRGGGFLYHGTKADYRFGYKMQIELKIINDKQ